MESAPLTRTQGTRRPGIWSVGSPFQQLGRAINEERERGGGLPYRQWKAGIGPSTPDRNAGVRSEWIVGRVS